MKIYLSIIAIVFSLSFTAHAAEVSVVAPENVIEGKAFSVLVLLDTEGTTINSFDITMSYPADIVSFSGYKEDGSIKRVWLSAPTDKGGSIHFSGIIPGGVDGMYDPDKKGIQPLPLLQLLFSAKDQGQGGFSISNSLILENDGKGTALVHSKKDTTIIVLESSSSINETTIENASNTDRTPPQPFDIEFVKAGFFSRTPSMILFSTVDLESGVQKYQLRNSRNMWEEVTSPLSMPKGLIERYVVVRAVDFGGNARESQIAIPGIVSPIQLGGIVLIGFVCYLVFYVLKRRR